MQRPIGSHYTMTRHIGCKRIAPQGLPYCLCTATSYASCQFAVCYGLSSRYVDGCQIYLALKLGYTFGMQHCVAYVINITHVINPSFRKAP